MSTVTLTIPSTPIPATLLPTPSPASSIDDLITAFLSTWSLSSTLLLLLTLTILLYPIFFSRDPDLHPFLLARQATAAPIRNKHESAVLRALDVPHGYPLRASLGVRDKGTPKWSPGRQGDLRDVWRVAAQGPVGEGGEHDASKVGKVVTVLGREGVEESSMGDVTRAINALGTWVTGKKEGGRVAVCLSNSVELLACVFAAAFYDFSVTLLPYGLSQEQTNALLAQLPANILIAEAGTLDVNSALSASKSVREVVLVAKGGSRHMDWDEAPAGLPQGIGISTWHNIVASGASREVLPVDKETKVRPLSTFCSTGNGQFELVEFTSENLVSGIAALSATAARDNKLNPSDVLLPTSSLTESYTLCWTLAALYANASIALNSVAGDNVDLALASAGVKPTVIVAAPATVNQYVLDTIKSGSGPGAVGRYVARQSLQAGNMPTKRPTVALSSLSRLRLLLIGQPAAQKNKVSSSTVHELRVLLGSRIAYALTTPKVAGAVSQTNVHDYRDKGEAICLGPPIGSVEIHVVGDEESMGRSAPQGRIVVKGPSVSGGKVELNTVAQVDTDHTLRLL